jgi:hypothetical protein
MEMWMSEMANQKEVASASVISKNIFCSNSFSPPCTHHEIVGQCVRMKQNMIFRIFVGQLGSGAI